MILTWSDQGQSQGLSGPFIWELVNDYLCTRKVNLVVDFGVRANSDLVIGVT